MCTHAILLKTTQHFPFLHFPSTTSTHEHQTHTSRIMLLCYWASRHWATLGLHSYAQMSASRAFHSISSPNPTLDALDALDARSNVQMSASRAFHPRSKCERDWLCACSLAASGYLSGDAGSCHERYWCLLVLIYAQFSNHCPRRCIYETVINPSALYVDGARYPRALVDSYVRVSEDGVARTEFRGRRCARSQPLQTATADRTPDNYAGRTLKTLLDVIRINWMAFALSIGSPALALQSCWLCACSLAAQPCGQWISLWRCWI